MQLPSNRTDTITPSLIGLQAEQSRPAPPPAPAIPNNTSLELLAASSGPATGPVSPAERDYLRRQGISILMNGGSEQDVVNFTKIHVGRPVETRAAITTSQPSDKEEAEVPYLLGLSASAVNSVTWGWGDDFFGSLAGLSPNITAEQGRDFFREIAEDFRGRHGATAFLLDLVGMGATGMGAAKAVGLGTGIMAQTLAGGVGGAVAGAGQATGGISDRTQAALTGAGIGAAFGGAVGTVGALGGSAIKQGVRGMLNRFDEMTKGVLVGRRPPQVGSADDFALEMIHDVVVKGEGLSTDTMRRKALAMRMTGVNPTLADVTGNGGLALLSHTYGKRTPVKQKLLELYASRQAAQGARMEAATIRSLMDVDAFGTQNAYTLQRELLRARKEAAAPAYRAAHRMMVPVSERTRGILERNHLFREAWEHARDYAKQMDLADEADGIPLLERGLPMDELPTPKSREQLLAEAPHLRGHLSSESEVVRAQAEAKLAELAGNVEFPAELPVRGLDYLQRGLRMVMNRLEGSGGLNETQYVALNRQMKIILDDLLDASPEFRRAHQAYAGTSAEIDIIKQARGQLPGTKPFFRKAPEEIAEELAEISRRNPELKNNYLVGVLQEVDDLIRGPMSRDEGSDIARRVFGSRTFRKPTDNDLRRFQVLFGDDKKAATAFTRFVTAEGRLSRTAESLTPERIKAAQNIEELADGGAPSVRMNVLLTALGAARDAMLQGSKAFRSEASDRIAQYFTYGMDDPKHLDFVLELMDDVAERRRAASIMGKAALGGATATIGGKLGAAIQ